MAKTRIADLVEVTNLKKRPAAAAKYSAIRVQMPDGTETHLLLTDAEMKRALDRARKNPEDLPPVSWVRDVFDLAKQ